MDASDATLALAILLVAQPLAGCIGPAGPDEPAAPAAVDEPSGGFSNTSVFEGDYDANGSLSALPEPGPHEALPFETVELDSRVDGSPLRIGIARPDVPDGARVPVIVLASPYFYDNVSPADPIPNGTTEMRTYDQARWLIDNFVPHGYAVGLVPRRGADLDGSCADLLGPAERAEVDQATTWLAQRPWSNGKVGFVGLSQDGVAGWEAAATGNPHVETIVPMAGYADLYTRLFWNGTWGVWSGARRALIAAGSAPSGPPLPSEGPAVARGALCESHVEGIAASMTALATGRGDPTGFWDAHGFRGEVEENYDGSVLLVQGLRDDVVLPHNVYPWIDRLATEGVVVKHLLGQWAHDRPDEAGDPDVEGHVRWDFAEIVLHWLDYWLKGETTRDLGPRVQVEDTQGRWRDADAWPPEDAVETAFNLRPGGDLAREPSSERDAVALAADPGAVGDAALGQVPVPDAETACRTCARFATEPLADEFRFAGLPGLDLTVTPAGPGGYLTAHLHAVGGDGDEVELTRGQVDLRYADAGRDPDPVTPGRPTEVTLTLEPVDAVVPEDSRLALVVGQQRHGTNVGSPAPVTLELGEGRSSLLLETFEVDPGAFFRPPG